MKLAICQMCFSTDLIAFSVSSVSSETQPLIQHFTMWLRLRISSFGGILDRPHEEPLIRFYILSVGKVASPEWNQ